MKPILYEATETTFSSNGLGRLNDLISCMATEERNGIYELELSVPVTGAHYAEIIPGRIVYATHDETGVPQPFEIDSYSRPINGVVTFHAVHISYRQRGIVAQARNISNLDDAFRALVETAQPSTDFMYSSDFTPTGYVAAFDGTPKSVRQLLGGVEGSILDAYGGEYEWDRFNVILHRNRGQQRDFVIRYGVNLLEYQDDTDYSGTYTSCIPYWTGDDNGTTVTEYGARVDIGQPAYNQQNICVSLDLSDKFETRPTPEELEDLALALMQNRQTHLPAQTIHVDFIRLQDLAGYDWMDGLMQCSLCDSIRVEFPEYSMSGYFKIVKTVWNVLEDRYESMELGALSTSLAEALGITGSSSGTVTGGGGGTQDYMDMITLTTNTTLTLTTNFATLPYNTIASRMRYGGFSFASSSVTCLKSGIVEAAAGYYYSGATTGALQYLYVMKNGSTMGGAAERAANTSDYITVAPFAFEVEEGDVITFQGKTTTGSPVFAQGGAAISHAFVRYLDASAVVKQITYNFDIDMIYPVGSIYMSVNSTSPSTFLPGTTWERIQDTFLLAGGTSYAPGGSGGHASHSYTPAGTVGDHTLNVNEIPAHYHAMRYGTSSGTSGAGWTWAGSHYTWSGATEGGAGMKGAGSGQAHNHGFTGTAATIPTMPPYLAVYVWKRTA